MAGYLKNWKFRKLKILFLNIIQSINIEHLMGAHFFCTRIVPG
jgi:hypothetical protein